MSKQAAYLRLRRHVKIRDAKLQIDSIKAWKITIRRIGPLTFFSLSFSISILVTLVIYLNKDYSSNFSRGLVYYKSSCLSRHVSSSYRRPSPHKPSPYLLTKIKHYEILHRRCGPNSPPYRRTMNKLVVKSRNRKGGVGQPVFSTAECNYVVWRPIGGLGNQMVSMVSAFLYALLTDRVLLVEFGPALVNLFCEPFVNDIDTSLSWILPKDFPHREEKFQSLTTFQTLMNDVVMRSNNISTTSATNVKLLPSFLYVNLVSESYERVKYFHCDESHSLLGNIPVLVTQSDLYYIPLLFMTPSFTEKLNKMFPVKTTAFHHLATYLFHPSDVVWNHIRKYYDSHLAEANVKVGLQIRIVKNHEVTPQQVMDQILSCTLSHGILPSPSLGRNLTFIKSPPQGLSSSLTSIAILVVSLFPDYAKNLTAMYGQVPTPMGNAIKVYQPSSDGYQKYDNSEQNMNAWIEMYLLSLCDKLVTTGESTFGYVAVGLAGLKPWVLRKQDKLTRQSVSCWRAMTMDPCLHLPPRYDCVARREVDLINRLFPEKINICEDRELGVRLSDHD